MLSDVEVPRVVGASGNLKEVQSLESQMTDVLVFFDII